MPELTQHVARAAELLAEADALIITAGAGMSVDSGLPDFRGGAVSLPLGGLTGIAEIADALTTTRFFERPVQEAGEIEDW